MIKVAVVGLGKMGLSHLAMIRPHPGVDVVAVCDSAGYLLDVLAKYTGLSTFTDYEEMLRKVPLDAVIIATPSEHHGHMVRAALERDLDVFCEKPLFLDPAQGSDLTALAAMRGRVTQVGYHNRYVGTFREVKKLLDAGAIGTVVTGTAQAYGPVALKPAGRTWRNKASGGGGCLYDYAAHPLDLVTWYLGMPSGVGGSRLTKAFSREIDDAVASTLYYQDGLTVQLNANWSDESQRKMTTSVTLWGTQGRIHADRQEVQVYLRKSAPIPPGYRAGWTVKYTTELTEPTWFYLRGEEYSAQLDDFVQRVVERRTDGTNTFRSGTLTDQLIELIRRDAAAPPPSAGALDMPSSVTTPPERRRRPTISRIAAGLHRTANRLRHRPPRRKAR